MGASKFQSTPPRGGATARAYEKALEGVISIHAPARGGDAAYQLKIDALEISIHAPARGGDTSAADRSFTSRNFNPRPREGGRPIPARASSAASQFQSTPPRGGATGVLPTSILLSIFQSTPPRGGATFISAVPSSLDIDFNPRPREGGRPISSVSGLFTAISIHAPARGGDSKDAQFYLRIFDKQVELLRFWGKMRGGCLRNPEKDRRFLGKSLANLPEISGHLDFAGA